MWSILSAIADAGHEVVFETFADPAEMSGTEEDLRRVCNDYGTVRIQVTSLSQSRSYFWRLCTIFSALPFASARFRSTEMQARLRMRLQEEAFDAIVCDNIYSAVNLEDTAIPVLMNCHNVEYLILQRFAKQDGYSAKALYARMEAIKLRHFEAAMCRRAKLAMACSNTDADLIRELCPGLQVVVVPNVVDVTEYQVTADEEEHTIVYQGGMDWYPNRDALEYFVRQVLPLVQKQVPEVRLIAAGRNPAPEFKALFSDVTALEFTGTLPDLRPVIAKAAVAVVPLRIGSGTRLKILEAGAMRKAMVSTSIGVEGLNFEAGKEILIADDPVTFARHVVELLHDSARRKTLGEAARNKVVHEYDRMALERSVASALASLEQSIGTEAGKSQLASVG
ncbi:MAG: glycosyltransferase [Candidatus Korobacteraceae bacterium]